MPIGVLKRLWIMLRLYRKHGRYRLFLFWSLVGPVFFVFTRFCLWLDNLVFRELHNITVENPVFIVGHPRSGSTYLQRRVYESDVVCMFTTWEMVFPSLVQRKLLAPLLALLEYFQVDVLQSVSKGHEIRLQQVEENEGLFLHQLDTEMVTVLCPWLLTDEEYRKVGLKLGKNDTTRNRDSLLFFETCLKRQIYHTGKNQVVAKCNPSIFRLQNILSVFPDARIVYLVRSPERTVQSFLSFTQKVIDPLLDSNELQILIQSKYHWCVELYEYFESIRPQIPPEQLLILPFHELSHNTINTLKRFFSFVRIGPPPYYWKKMTEEVQKPFRKEHMNAPLDSLGISRERVRTDLQHIWERYLQTE